MTACTSTLCRDGRQKGFTLVELAIVMVIIGVLIAGVLKGQELIDNSRVTATIAQVKAFDAALNTFRDNYNALPGDMLGPQGRLPGCTVAPCNAPGNGDGVLNVLPGALPAGEGLTFWIHLAAANLITGVLVNPATGGVVDFGDEMPAAALAGGYTVGYSNAGALTAVIAAGAAATPRGGHYLVVSNSPTAAVAAATAPLLASHVARIDRKLDDGAPNTGVVLAAGNAACATATGVGATYVENRSNADCTFYARVQN